jgi:hypothetical protein
VPRAFDLLDGLTIAFGIGFILISCDRLPAWTLHAMPLITIAETAIGIGVLGTYDDTLDYAIARHLRSGGCLTVMVLDLDGL